MGRPKTNARRNGSPRVVELGNENNLYSSKPKELPYYVSRNIKENPHCYSAYFDFELKNYGASPGIHIYILHRRKIAISLRNCNLKLYFFQIFFLTLDSERDIARIGLCTGQSFNPFTLSL